MKENTSPQTVIQQTPTPSGEKPPVPPVPAPTPPLPPTPHNSHPSMHFPASRILLIILLVLVTLFAIAYAGTYYLLNQQLDKLTHRNQESTQTTVTPTSGFPINTESTITPTCTPRPACLDTEPRCLLPETPDMCPKATPTTSQSQTVCTQDAKQCSDGSYVSRQGPNCEFAPCPN